MKNTIMAALVATVFGISAANAEGLYVGVGGEYVQSTAKHADSTAAGSVRIGTDINKFVAGELNVNTAMANGNQRANTSTTANVLVGYPVDLATFKVKPYGVVGTGYDFAYLKHSDDIHTNPVYNYGAGVQLDLAKNIALDVRYTRVEDYNSKAAANVFGLGVNYRF
jgi:opacity protein-like surface antigen